MTINSGLLLRGKPITVLGVGKIHSPILKDIFQDEESFMRYASMRAIITGNAGDLRKLIDTMKLTDNYSDMTDLAYQEAKKYELLWHSQILRKFFADGLRLFCDDQIGISEENQCFILVNSENQISGVIDQNNYDSVQQYLLSTLSPSEERRTDVKFASKAAQELWNKQNELEDKTPEGNPEDFTLTNIISKLACGTTGYTLFDIYDLSVYQLMETFGSYSQHRTAGVSERAYSHWGGEEFDPLMWMHNNN